MYQYQTPGIRQHPTPQNTFSDVESGNANKYYLRQRLRSETPEKNVPSEPATVNVAEAFFDGLTRSAQSLQTTKFQHPSPVTTSSSPGKESASLIQNLKAEYCYYAADLHDATVDRLQEVHSMLGATVESVKDQDEAFRSVNTGLDSQVRPLNANHTWHEVINQKTGRKMTDRASLEDCIKISTDRLTDLETEVQQLWNRWEDTQTEVLTMLREMEDKGLMGSRQKGDTAQCATLAEISDDFMVLEKEWEDTAKAFMKTAKATEKNAYTAGCDAIAGLVQRKMLSD